MSDPNHQPPSSLLAAISIYAGTDIGLRREENQDSFGVIETPHFKVCMVADGMGGVRGGAIASRIAVDVIREHLSSLQELSTAQILNAINKANTAIFEKGSADPELNGMGTTLVLLGFAGEKLMVAHVGDSRAYRIRRGVLTQLTEDHTLVNELVRAGSLSSDQVENHPVSHMLTRSLGPVADVEIDCFEVSEDISGGDRYLLCSDGLYNMVHSEEFLEVFDTVSIEDTPSELISLANLRGGTDNITTICVSVGREEAHQQGHASTQRTSSSPKIQAALDDFNLSTDSKIPAEEGTENQALTDEELAPKVQSIPATSNTSRIRYAIVIAAVSAIITVAIELGRIRQYAPSVVESSEVALVTAPASKIEMPIDSTSANVSGPVLDATKQQDNSAAPSSNSESSHASHSEAGTPGPEAF
jgi:serine/threonine protein phosphatase PrpC